MRASCENSVPWLLRLRALSADLERSESASKPVLVPPLSPQESSQLGVQVMCVFCYVYIIRIIGAPQSGPPRPPAAACSQSIAPTPAFRSAVLARGFARPCTQRNSIYYGTTADKRVVERHRRLSSVMGRAAMWPRCSRVVRIKRAQRKSQCGMNLGAPAATAGVQNTDNFSARYDVPNNVHVA